MNKNFKVFFIIVLTVSLLLINAQDQDKKKKDNPKKNHQYSPNGKEKKRNDNRTVIQANENFIADGILGRPTDKSISINTVPAKDMVIYYEYGISSGNYSSRTSEISAHAGKPSETVIDNLQKNTLYYYRFHYRLNKNDNYSSGTEHFFVTQRAQGSTFTFAIQGDSHPERDKQFDPELYKITLNNVKKARPDFYMTIGDDFSVDTLPEITREAVSRIYLYQRYYLGIVGSSAPVFFVNGNHEQAVRYILDGTANNNAIWAQNARNSYYPQPAPDDFYSGDEEKVEFIGYLRDYYAWTWGDALFVVIDSYWHSDVAVDNDIMGNEKRNDLWDITLGDAQYQWLKKTLSESSAKYKFVFTHHVLGTGRAGIDMADLYEWGGKSKNGEWEFDKKRRGWELPIQQLMAKNKVTIFFQGHDHIFVKQVLEGVIYQELPEPADFAYMAYNDDAYITGVKFPNSGFVKVTVTKKKCKG